MAQNLYLWLGIFASVAVIATAIVAVVKWGAPPLREAWARLLTRLRRQRELLAAFATLHEEQVTALRTLQRQFEEDAASTRQLRVELAAVKAEIQGISTHLDNLDRSTNDAETALWNERTVMDQTIRHLVDRVERLENRVVTPIPAIDTLRQHAEQYPSPPSAAPRGRAPNQPHPKLRAPTSAEGSEAANGVAGNE